MPIPQSKSNFHKRKVRDNNTQFTSRKININKITKKGKNYFIFNKRRKKSFNFIIKKKKPLKNKIPLFKKILPKFIILLLFGGMFTIVLFAYYSKDLPNPNKIIDRSISLSTKIYDRTGEELLYEIHGPENRTLIQLEELPDYVKNATIAIEDKNFYEHKGISLLGIIRGQIIPRIQGKRSQGGSTLTQQFVKNAILTNERKISRKIKEWILSYRLEQKFTKDEILQLYFNEIPYGSSSYGIESASFYYFGKTAKELTLAEAAILASLPKAPSYLSPYGGNLDELMNRQETVLNLMVEQEFITEIEAKIAKNQDLVFRKRAEQIKAPHFVMYIKELLSAKYGETVIEQSGWNIRTSLDWNVQKKAEEVIEEIAPYNLEQYEANNAALVSLDVATGEILALVGSKNFFNNDIDGQVNVALAERQPGSSLKPLVYLTAFTKGFNPETIVFDLGTNFSVVGDDYEPHNYDLKEYGPVSLKKSLAGSLNIASVKTLYLAGVQNVLDNAEKFGYTTLKERDRYGLSLVLGGGEVKLLDHVQAYSVFARDGVYKENKVILEIKDSTGKVIEDNSDNKGRRVVDKEYIRMLNNILSDNDARKYMFGENNYLILNDRPVAVKTGTTNNYRDAWTIGYTPSIVTGVWVGNNDNTEMKKGASGSVVAAPIWNKFMKDILKDYPKEEFKNIDINDCDKVMVCGKLAQENIVEIDSLSGKLATEYTPYTTREEKIYSKVHNILHYVDIDNPLGDLLINPSDEPQYDLWEDVVQTWLEEQGHTTEELPTDFDDIHLEKLKPSIRIESPDNNKDINNSNILIEVKTESLRGIRRVEYFIDSQKIGTSTNQPFDFNYQINPFLSSGYHELKAIAFDDLDNWQEDIISINLEIDRSSQAFNLLWIDPVNGSNIAIEDLPIELHLNINNPEKIKKIDFYYMDQEDSNHWFTYKNNFVDDDIYVNWGEGFGAGVYKLYMIIKDLEDKLITTPAIIVNLE